MTLYRKKPIVVSAFRWTGDFRNVEIPDWLLRALGDGIVDLLNEGTGQPVYAEIRTLEGRMIANPGDWIVRGVEGEIYPVKPSVFNASYELEVNDHG